MLRAGVRRAVAPAQCASCACTRRRTVKSHRTVSKRRCFVRSERELAVSRTPTPPASIPAEARLCASVFRSGRINVKFPSRITILAGISTSEILSSPINLVVDDYARWWMLRIWDPNCENRWVGRSEKLLIVKQQTQRSIVKNTCTRTVFLSSYAANFACTSRTEIGIDSPLKQTISRGIRCSPTSRNRSRINCFARRNRRCDGGWANHTDLKVSTFAEDFCSPGHWKEFPE